MNREYLESLGLEKDAIDHIMKEHGKAVQETKKDLESVTTERDDLKGQLVDRDTQLDSLKGIDHEGLKSKIAELETANEATATEYQAKLDKQAFNFTLDKSLTGAKVRNAKAVKALLDTENIKLDGDKLLNLDDQLKALKESDPYLFEEQEETPPPGKPSFSSGSHGKDGSTTVADFGKMTYTQRLKLKQDNPKEYEALTDK